MRLYVVATPIGNLGDITLRALEVLKDVDVVLCEDTRRTVKLLSHFNIKKPLISYHRHSNIEKTERIAGFLRAGKKIALVSDSGTPGLCDPGNKLIEELFAQFGNELDVVPIPGASAIAALASVAGINMDKFVFLGFPPQKKGRQTFFKEVGGYETPVVLYESPHRIIKALESLVENQSQARLIVGKELTKMFEKIYRGSPADVLAEILKDGPRGEYTLIISNF